MLELAVNNSPAGLALLTQFHDMRPTVSGNPLWHVPRKNRPDSCEHPIFKAGMGQNSSTGLYLTLPSYLLTLLLINDRRMLLYSWHYTGTQTIGLT